jgi:hypothetical protein
MCSPSADTLLFPDMQLVIQVMHDTSSISRSASLIFWSGAVIGVFDGIREIPSVRDGLDGILDMKREADGAHAVAVGVLEDTRGIPSILDALDGIPDVGD